MKKFKYVDVLHDLIGMISLHTATEYRVEVDRFQVDGVARITIKISRGDRFLVESIDCSDTNIPVDQHEEWLCLTLLARLAGQGLSHELNKITS